MQKSPYLGFVGGFETARSPMHSQERTVNFYVEASGSSGALTPAALYLRPGLTAFAAHATKTRVRALFEENGRCFAVIGDTFCEVFVDGTITDYGTVLEAAAGTPATITSNGDGGGDLFIASGDHGYAFDLATNVLTEVLIRGCASADAVDGFITALDTSDSTLQSSSLYDASDFPATFIEQRSTAPDPWLTHRVLNRLIYLFGERSTDIYYNAGLAAFPFAKHTAGAFQWGVAAVHSVAVVNQALIWLARSGDDIGAVVVAQGSSAQEISTPALRAVIDGYRRTVGITDAIGESFALLGHTFYVLTFPAADATWVYDVTTKTWVEWLSWVSAEGRYAAWRPHWHSIAFGKHLVGDRLTGDIYELDPTTNRDAGETIRGLRQPPALYADSARITIDELEIQVETGIGPIQTDPTEPAPVIVLNYSKDRGRTWRQASSPKSVGVTGDYNRRVIWNRLGTARQFGFQVICSDNYPYRLFGALLSPRPGAGT
jgi:hypothetical protein